MKAILFGIITVLGSCTEIREEVNPEGPWYSEVSLTVNPSLRSDMYMCSNYHKHTVGEAFKLRQQKHTVPIICGPKGGQCGIVSCDCVCHKK